MATKQAYFAVAVNDDSTMYIDDYMGLMTEDNMPIWNEETQLWEDISEHEGFYDEAHAQLRRLIDTHNKGFDK